MREALFVKQNSAKWKAYETVPATNPDELAERFIHITDDLAYAKTFYPKSKTTLYLNSLASGFHQSIYRNRKEKVNRFIYFWQYELPLLFYTYRWQLLFAFLFFMASFLIGVFSARFDHDFVRLILGDNYVNMTNENIAKGDPFGVYKSQNEWLMLWMIAENNLKVMAQTYVLGAAVSIGTIYALFKNGIMVGSFQYFFISKGLGIPSVLVIWLHGTLEMSCCIIAGAAGLIMGNAILFPGTYTRLVSFKKGAMSGLKIMLGISPIVFTAAVIESFATRHTGMPVWLSSGVLVASALFIVWYVVLYPLHISNKIKPVNAR